MILGLTRLLDALLGDSRAEELALMEAHGVATPEEFSRADPPFDVILDEMAGYLGVAGAAAGRLTCRAWCTALGRTRTMAQLVQREATAGGLALPMAPWRRSRAQSPRLPRSMWLRCIGSFASCYSHSGAIIRRAIEGRDLQAT